MRYGGAVEKHDENGVATAGGRTQANPDAAEGVAEPGHGDSACRTTSILRSTRPKRAPCLCSRARVRRPRNRILAEPPCRCRSRTYVALRGRARGTRARHGGPTRPRAHRLLSRNIPRTTGRWVRAEECPALVLIIASRVRASACTRQRDDDDNGGGGGGVREASRAERILSHVPAALSIELPPSRLGEFRPRGGDMARSRKYCVDFRPLAPFLAQETREEDTRLPRSLARSLARAGLVFPARPL